MSAPNEAQILATWDIKNKLLHTKQALFLFVLTDVLYHYEFSPG